MAGVTRFVVTHINKNGDRVLTFPRQGLYTCASEAEAGAVLSALLDVETNGNDIPGVYGEQAMGTFEVRPIQCHPEHFDPMTCWF